MKNLRNISLVLALLCASGLFAQTPAAQAGAATPAPTWAAARKNLQVAYANFIHAASRDDRSDGAFNTQMLSMLDATNQIHRAQASLATQPGAAYRDVFARNTVMCQRTAILYWQANSRMDSTPGHFYAPPSGEVVACMKTLAKPDPEQ
jgi:hypothetical protein